MIVKAKASALGPGAQLHFELPRGFRGVADMPLPGFINELARRATIEVLDAPAGRYTLAIELVGPPPDRRVLATSRAIVAITDERLSLPAYLMLGLLGIALGYPCRVLVRILASVEPSAHETLVAPPLGRIRQFVLDHFYAVDFGVTLVLGFAALLALTQGLRPPDAGAFWPGAVLTGFALGLFTNSEMVVKIRR